MKLSYKDGRTIVEVDGKQMRALEAIIKYPERAAEIVAYSKRAKKISGIKMVTITHHDRYVSSNPTTRERVEQPEVWVVETSYKGKKQTINCHSYDDLELACVSLGLRTTKGDCFFDGIPTAKGNYEFVQSYLSEAECDLNTGRITTSVEPNFDIDSLIEIQSPNQRSWTDWIGRNWSDLCYSLGDGKVLLMGSCRYGVRNSVDNDYEYSSWDYFTDSSFRIIDSKLPYELQSKEALYIEKEKHEDCDENPFKKYYKKGYIAGVLEKAGVTDLTNMKVDSIIDGINKRTKIAEDVMSKK